LNIKTNSAQLELELGLSLAIQKQTKSLGHKRRLFLPPPPPLDAYVPICWYTAVGVCAVRKFGFCFKV
jgi:hypothetical protein